MCITPTIVHVPKGNKYQRIEVPCGHCWACIKNRQNDLTAKMLMEMETSNWAFVVTLTYDDEKLERGDKSAQTINKYHFKKLVAHLRKNHSLKFLVAGEYGKRKRRAHFHAAFLGVGKAPEIPPYRTRASWHPEGQRQAYWPHGFSYFDECDAKSIEYIAKYLTKGRIKKTDEEPEQEWISYSKVPPLGAAYVIRLADDYVAQKVFPRSFRVNPQGSSLLNRRMQISGLSQHLFLDRIFAQWPEAIEAKKTEWMENAATRWKKWKQTKTFDVLPIEEQLQILNESLRLHPAQDESLTEARLARIELEQRDDFMEQAQWLNDLDQQRRQRVNAQNLAKAYAKRRDL